MVCQRAVNWVLTRAVLMAAHWAARLEKGKAVCSVQTMVGKTAAMRADCWGEMLAASKDVLLADCLVYWWVGKMVSFVVVSMDAHWADHWDAQKAD